MGYDLRGGGEEFHWAIGGWESVLKLARQYGWEPQGTEAPRSVLFLAGRQIEEESRDDWDGSYFSNDYQVVTQEDARALADALDRALPDVPDHDCSCDEHGHLRQLRRANLLERFSGSSKDYLKKFIRFCRLESFMIA